MDKEKLCNKLVVFATFLRSINATCESNENGRFSAQLGRAKLMSAREIEDVVFLADTKIFEERKHMAFLLLLRPKCMQKQGEFNFSSLAELYLISVDICS